VTVSTALYFSVNPDGMGWILVREWEVDRTGSGSFPVAGFSVRRV
jgi:hypothetical protein